MKNAMVWVVLIVLGAMAAWYFSMREDQAALEQVAVRPAPIQPELVEEPRFPVEDIALPIDTPSPEPVTEEEPEPAEPLPPLPTLAESDAEAMEQAEGLLPEADLAALLVPEYLISRMVSSIDGLDARRLPQPMRPIQPVPGKFEVLEANDQAVISPANGERYAPYLTTLSAIDIDAIVPLYVRYYPLIQEAYLGLGYQDVYFNDRLIEILDHLLATPEPLGLIEVKQNEAVYEFVDPELEALSVGQKALLRVSAEDRQQVKQTLRRLRDSLAGARLLEPGT